MTPVPALLTGPSEPWTSEPWIESYLERHPPSPQTLKVIGIAGDTLISLTITAAIVYLLWKVLHRSPQP